MMIFVSKVQSQSPIIFGGYLSVCIDPENISGALYTVNFHCTAGFLKKSFECPDFFSTQSALFGISTVCLVVKRIDHLESIAR